MGWTNDQATEITAPTNVPFQPGNDVIGIGTTLPPELLAGGVTSAIVFYNSGWNPASTSPSVKFMWIGTLEGGSQAIMCLGMGICQNPSVSQTAVVTRGFSLAVSLVAGGTVETIAALCNAADTPIWNVGADASHAAFEIGVNPSSGTLWRLPGTTLPGPT